MDRSLATTTLAAVISGMPLLGCDAEEQVPSLATVYDSAGVEIVENPDDPALRNLIWQIDPEPIVRIGMADGPEAYQFFAVRAAVRLSDGRLVVLNGGTEELRYYDEDGSHLETVGGRGGGPGEFSSAGVMRRTSADTLLIWDRARSLLSWFSPDGRYVRSQTVVGDGWTDLFGAQYVTDVLTVLSDGSLLLRGRTAQRQASVGWDRPPLALARTSAVDLARVDTLGWYRGLEHYNVGSASQPLMRSVPHFARTTHVTAGGDPMRIFVSPMENPVGAHGAGYDVHVFGSDGSLERIIRHLRPARAISGDEVERARERERAMYESMPVAQTHEWINEQVRSLPVPDVSPPHAEIMVDSAGNIWVQGWDPVPTERRRFTVFGHDGHGMGEVEVPQNFRVMDIGGDYILGVWRNEDNVEFIHLYALRTIS